MDCGRVLRNDQSDCSLLTWSRTIINFHRLKIQDYARPSNSRTVPLNSAHRMRNSATDIGSGRTNASSKVARITQL